MNRNHLEPWGHYYQEIFIRDPFISKTKLSKTYSPNLPGTVDNNSDDNYLASNYHMPGIYTFIQSLQPC